jgi:hypothetical protein
MYVLKILAMKLPNWIFMQPPNKHKNLAELKYDLESFRRW